MLIRIIILAFALSTSLTNNVYASQTPKAPEAQFELAQQLALEPNQESTTDVRYWLEQSAHQGYVPAQKQLAEDYARGLNGNIDHSQAIYWYTSVALDDPIDRGFLLANFVQHHQNEISNSDLVEAWYQLSALTNPNAEEAYNQLLEERFNQLRAKQVSEIVEKDKEAIGTGKTQRVAETGEPNIWFAFGVLAVVLLITASIIGYRQRTQKRKHKQSHSQQLETQVKELQFDNKQLKRRLEKVFKEFKKMKNQSENQKLLIACAMFGYTPQTIPDSKAVKLRYRQLSKLYHPDSRGSEEEMKRLNQAFKAISQNVTKE